MSDKKPYQPPEIEQVDLDSITLLAAGCKMPHPSSATRCKAPRSSGKQWGPDREPGS